MKRLLDGLCTMALTTQGLKCLVWYVYVCIVIDVVNMIAPSLTVLAHILVTL